jgi:hypothetical protein
VREESRRRRNSCLQQNPGAPICEEPLRVSSDDRDEIVRRYIAGIRRRGRNLSSADLRDCSPVGELIPTGVIYDCDNLPAMRFHCRIRGITDQVSIFGCLCCGPDGQAHYQWSRPHWSENLSRRGR